MNDRLAFDTSITLAEAIQKLGALEENDALTNKMSAEVKQLLEQHDAVHILFNCGTSIEDEIAAHIWMLFATTAKIGEMHSAVASQEHRNALSGIGHFKLISIWFASIPRIIAIIFKSLRMKKKVPLEELCRLKQQSIFEIRQEYAIAL